MTRSRNLRSGSSVSMRQRVFANYEIRLAGSLEDSDSRRIDTFTDVMQENQAARVKLEDRLQSSVDTMLGMGAFTVKLAEQFSTSILGGETVSTTRSGVTTMPQTIVETESAALSSVPVAMVVVALVGLCCIGATYYMIAYRRCCIASEKELDRSKVEIDDFRSQSQTNACAKPDFVNLTIAERNCAEDLSLGTSEFTSVGWHGSAENVNDEAECISI